MTCQTQQKWKHEWILFVLICFGEGGKAVNDHDDNGGHADDNGGDDDAEAMRVCRG